MTVQQPSASQQPEPKPRGLTPVQIGAGVGAALTILVFFGLRDLWPGAGGSLSNFLIGGLGAIGALLGMAVVSLVGFLRDRNRQKGPPARLAGEATAAAVQATREPPSPREGKGNPILRVAAGLLALMFGGGLLLMTTQGNFRWDGGVLVAALAILFGWYAVRGNKGLPQALTKK